MSAVVDDPVLLAERPARSGWFVSPRVDVVLVLGLGALLSVILSLTTVHKGAFLVAAVAFSLLSDYPHVLATSARVWLDPRERQRYWRHYLVSWVVVAVALSALMFSGATVVVVAVWAYWQVFHVLKQHFGVINIYAAKNGYRGPRKLLKYSLFATCLAPFVYRASRGLHFSDYEVLGHRLPFSELTVPTPPIPVAAVAAVFALALVLTILLGIEQLRIHRAGGRTLPAMAWATFGLAVVSYNTSYLLVSDLFALILIATTTHSLQYHLINWTRNNTRFRLSSDPVERRLLLARLSSRRALPLYVLAFAIVGVIAGQLDTVLLGVIPLTFVFHHFYMDGALWKSKGNPELAYDLGIAGGKR